MIKIKLNKKIHVKKGDMVKVITGRDKGNIGKIKQVFYKTNKVIVEGVSIHTKHIKSTQQQNTGQIIKREMPIHSSNVMLYSEKTKVASRYSYKISSNTPPIKQRILKKTQEIIT